jgi:transposase
LFFEDEARFGRMNKVQRCWTLRGLKVSVKHQLVREFIYTFSALCPQTGDLTSLILPTADTEAMNLFLQVLSKRYKRQRIILCMDKAGWHTAHALQIPVNIRLWYLPPYSPELNPVEILWRQIRHNYFNNKSFDTLDDVENQLVIALKAYSDDKSKIRKFSHFPWMP